MPNLHFDNVLTQHFVSDKFRHYGSELLPGKKA